MADSLECEALRERVVETERERFAVGESREARRSAEAVEHHDLFGQAALRPLGHERGPDPRDASRVQLEEHAVQDDARVIGQSIAR